MQSVIEMEAWMYVFGGGGEYPQYLGFFSADWTDILESSEDVICQL